MLPEAVDGALSAPEQRVFDAHIAGCAACSLEFAEAQRGAAWLGMLKSTPPEPPAQLLARILAETSGQTSIQTSAAAIAPRTPVAQPRPARQWTLPAVPMPSFGLRLAALRGSFSEAFSMGNAQSIFQPRLAMTAAMAFFSIALTLNLTGVRLRDVRAENFTPSGIKRSVADTTASLTRSFQNNRSVYEVESRLNEIHQDDAVQQEGGPSR
jgi:anti-sigma factor RsiW